MKSLKSCRVNVMVSDMDAVVAFYQGKLGLELLNRYGNHYAEIQTPDLLIALHPNTDKVKTGNNLTIKVFYHPDSIYLYNHYLLFLNSNGREDGKTNQQNKYYRCKCRKCS